MVASDHAKDELLRGIARLVSGDRAGALADFSEAIDIDPSCPEAYNNRGVTRHAGNDLAGALADFDRALEIAPRFAEAYNNRGAVRRALGDLDGAIADLDRAIELNSRYVEAFNNRGDARLASGDLDGAIADFDRALESRPDYAEALNNRGAARRARGDLGGAVADFDRALRGARGGGASAATYHNRGLARRDLGDHAGAIADLTESLMRTPPGSSSAVFHDRGVARHALGDFAGAIADYSRAIELDPRLCVAYISRGNARFHRRDAAAGLDYWVAFAIDAPFTAGEIVRLIAVDLRRDPEAVLTNCRKHLRINPADSVAYARRALCLLLQGKDEEAKADLDEVLRLCPEWKPHVDRLVVAARRLRDLARGEAVQTPHAGESPVA
ncbi:MAG TPA: tetratricopeptide repeat protein [Isosphaeraceae bacterium]|nr:tetratricopeptide repeat protein [Isosphaeraceae bacterium]